MASSSESGNIANKATQESGDDKFAHEVVLQRHAAFFDRNHDGLIYPWETFQGKKFPNLLFPINIKNIHLGKHGSDTDAYDTEGRFDAAKFEEIFTKHAHTYPNALTKQEMKALLKANREPKDFAGWLGALAEWPLLYSLAKDENGLLQKETVRAVYDGSLFETLEQRHSASNKKK